MRRRLLEHKRVIKLTRHVDGLRETTGWGRDIPYFDPLDGGVVTKVLFESPGEGALASGFVSRDNRDPSAAKFAALNREADLDRELTASWTTVPWALGRAPTVEDLEDAKPLLGPTLECFGRLEVVVLSGTAARSRREEIEGRDIGVWEMPASQPAFVAVPPGERGKDPSGSPQVPREIQRLSATSPIHISSASPPRWARSRRSNWRWSSGYALVPCSRNCVQGEFSEVHILCSPSSNTKTPPSHPGLTSLKYPPDTLHPLLMS
jgi:hypothetical protein